MTAYEVLAALSEQGIHSLVEGDELILRGKVKSLPRQLRDTLPQYKPDLLILLRERDDPERFGGFNWIEGRFSGPHIETYPVGRCMSCDWTAPLTADGSCVLCKQAERNGITGRWCIDECSEPIIGRIDPGGLFCCAVCRERVRGYFNGVNSK